MPNSYQIRVCENPACGLRYPLTEGHPFGERCPLCLGETRVVLTQPLTQEPPHPPQKPTRHVEALLDNIRSAWNVGAMFRTADGVGVAHLHLCGITPTPENESVRKTALGAESAIPWTYARDAVRHAQTLQKEGALLIALEQAERASSLYRADLIESHEPNKQIILVVGNEVTGIDPGLLAICREVVHIPMRGQKRSLNVEVAFGIATSMLLMG
jgi:tRNA G18 (ribose-2'-O)-methylase SpoU